MADLAFYGYGKCSTCRDAAKWLQQRGHKLEYHDLFEQAPDVEVLRKLWRTSGLELKKLFNVSGEVYREMGLKDKLPAMSEQEQLELLASNGRLIKRPIVTDGVVTTVGFKKETYEQVWDR
ncbi:arsenate reductase family protein [Paenibacillus thermoaerophilus]|uniref:Arsenate reductase family protein n=1 Tax=Paenibacillus thermoaerophilus TaxID=1215385 RepID=A0ABW2V1G1_9BACL|nr:arsenate reductase family protein [Paenibacillus thermoaerophilus]TMV18501.1 arsenate reductase family protein [Paenibacillus thermoaerophilus]